MTAGWEHFADWKRINSEGEAGRDLAGDDDPRHLRAARLLDLVENFTLFQEAQGGLIKIIAKNHQFLGVNNAIEALHADQREPGQAGRVLAHAGQRQELLDGVLRPEGAAQAAGQLDLRRRHRPHELDEQIYKNFADAGVVTEEERQAESGEHLKQLLTEDHRFVFTLIQKFRTEKGRDVPDALGARRHHRDDRRGAPQPVRHAGPEHAQRPANAAFIGFTGTPLMAGEEKTREVFGDYVSIYNFRQSIEDGATVPLYYENRIPELQLTNENLNEDMEALLEAAELDEEQEKQAGAGVRPRVPPDHPRRPAGEGGRRPRGALHRARLAGQGDGGLHRQG